MRPSLLRGLALGCLLLGGPGRLTGQQPCPRAAGEAVAAGWAAYRADSIAVAAQYFRNADTLCPGAPDARVGLGYTALRQSLLDQADSLFRLVTGSHPDNGDAWMGLAHVATRRGDRAAAAEAARRVLALRPADDEARTLLDRIEPGWDRPPPPRRTRPAALQVQARTRGEHFEIPAGAGRWSRFYIKGVNIGAALPGRFPSEFPQDSALYARWLEQIAGMNANVVRLYTILPPTFYRALRGWNLRHPDRQLWLVHGVWTELPPDDDFDHPGWKSEFHQEMRRVVDLLHGTADIPVRPGHAGGRYDADVSRWTLAYIIGREWEPYAVTAYDEANPGRRPWRGRYLAIDSAPALDRWMAEQCEYLLRYEVDRYNGIRPIAYTNWPTLDPLTHPTEATTTEEIAWRKRLGRPAEMLREYENDAIGLDANLVRPTRNNPAGWFASYHAYPYYPDFMLYDPEYNQASSPEGRSNYFGYLRDLRAHHQGIPLVIAEYGVPSSRGNAHFQPQGWTHGGHDEAAMARIDARLTREIRASGAAGGILFAWIDEWFKKNWVVVDLQLPTENTRRWHNTMDAEQHYGVLGMFAGRRADRPHLGGDPGRWLDGTTLYSAPSGRAAGLVIRSDEAHVYLALPFPQLAGREFPWDSLQVSIVLDTWLPRAGQHRLPGARWQSEPGFEFLLQLRGPGDAEIRVLPEYNPYGAAPGPDGDDLGRFYRRPVQVVDRDDARFDSLYVTINRARFGRDGTFFPARGYNRGRLRFGTEESSTLSDWYYDRGAGLLEIRIPWMLLNVSDPSTRTLLHESEGGDGFGTVQAGDWHFGVVLHRPGGETIQTLPARRADETWALADFTAWTWAGWETPEYHERMKPVYEAMRETWGAMTAGGASR